jgi:hypothetical protein
MSAASRCLSREQSAARRQECQLRRGKHAAEKAGVATASNDNHGPASACWTARRSLHHDVTPPWMLLHVWLANSVRQRGWGQRCGGICQRHTLRSVMQQQSHLQSVARGKGRWELYPGHCTVLLASEVQQCRSG